MELIEILKNEDRETVENAIVRDNIGRIARDIMVVSYTLLNTWKGDKTTAIDCLSYITLQAKQGLKLFSDTGFNKNEVTKI
jgi:hypothetical protein